MAQLDKLGEVVTIRDVAKFFGRKERTIRRWIARGVIRSFKVGGSRYIRSCDVEKLIDTNCEL